MSELETPENRTTFFAENIMEVKERLLKLYFLCINIIYQ